MRRPGLIGFLAEERKEEGRGEKRFSIPGVSLIVKLAAATGSAIKNRLGKFMWGSRESRFGSAVSSLEPAFEGVRWSEETEHEAKVFVEYDDTIRISEQMITRLVCAMKKDLSRQMPAVWKAVGEKGETHITHMSDSSGIDRDELAREWCCQRLLVLLLEMHHGLHSTEVFDSDQREGFIAVTESNSLVVGNVPDSSGIREIQYHRLPSRRERWSLPTKMTAPAEPKRNLAKIGDKFLLYGYHPTSPVWRILVVPPWKVPDIEFVTREIQLAVGDLERLSALANPVREETVIKNPDKLEKPEEPS